MEVRIFGENGIIVLNKFDQINIQVEIVNDKDDVIWTDKSISCSDLEKAIQAIK